MTGAIEIHVKHTPHHATGKVAPTAIQKAAVKRQTKPRLGIAPAPVAISQLNCVQVVGIDPRRYLELLVAHPEVPRSVVGKLRVVAVEDFTSLLVALRFSRPLATDIVEDADDETPTTADAVLAELGLRRAGGSR